MSSVIIAGDVSGSVTLQAPATAGSTVVNLPSTLGNTGTSSFATTDASGNLGLGVTPSAWGTANSEKVIQNPAGALWNFQTGYQVLGQNYYRNSAGNKIYTNTAAATEYQQTGGEHRWYNAASGTAGSAISFTQAMTLDANGNLGVGITNPSVASSSTKIYAYSSSGGNSLPSNAPLIVEQTGNTVLCISGSAASEAGIFMPRSTDAYYCGVYRSDTSLILRNNGAERARIDSSGNLLVAKTASGATTLGFQALSDGSTASTLSGSTNGSTTSHVYSTGAAAYRFYVGMAGTVYATSTSISAISDQTLKTNVRDLETGLTQVMASRPRRFDWINGDASDVAGFVAQEVEEVLPELVTDYIYNIDEEGNNVIKKSLKMGDILPTLVKSIQEQQALITQLQADVAALKGN